MKTINAEALREIIEILLLDTNNSITEGTVGGLFTEAFPEAPVEKWKPKNGQAYWYINFLFLPSITNCIDNSGSDEGRIAVGNCFPTEQSCQEAIDKIKKALAE